MSNLAFHTGVAVLTAVFLTSLVIVYNTAREKVGVALSASLSLAVAVLPQLFFLLYLYEFGTVDGELPQNEPAEFVLSCFLGGVIVAPLVAVYLPDWGLGIARILGLLVPTTTGLVYVVLFRAGGLRVPGAALSRD